jgi:transcriptional regulator with XRE-family HTH domain
MTSSAWALCRDARARGGLSQRALAARAGVTPATIARIEKGRMQPTLALLERIARAAGFSLTVALEQPDPDERKARLAARALTVEQRLRQNDRLSALRATRPR